MSQTSRVVRSFVAVVVVVVTYVCVCGIVYKTKTCHISREKEGKIRYIVFF